MIMKMYLHVLRGFVYCLVENDCGLVYLHKAGISGKYSFIYLIICVHIDHVHVHR